jgi:tetratricopeptide (TPR) repeat protein
MRLGKYLLLLLLTFRFEAFYAQSGSGKSEVWQFMVRNAMRMDDIGVRFNTDVREVKKLSKVRGKIVMPGTVLFIPVKLRPVTWDPTNFNPNDVVLPKEVMRPKKDYELDFTVIDPEIINDFIMMDDMVKDSIQIGKILRHVSRIDKKVKQLEYSLDSLKKAEFSFDYDENDKNSVIQKMEMARQRFYRQGPVGKEIDSLKEISAKLGQEINKMNARINDYDFLKENQNYFSQKKRPLTYAATQVIPQWGNQIKQEAKYYQSTNQPTIRKPEKEMAVAPPSSKPEPTAQAKQISDAPTQEVKPIAPAPITGSMPAIQQENGNSKEKEKVGDVINQNISEDNPKAHSVPAIVQDKTTNKKGLIGDQKEDEEIRDDDLAGLYDELDSINEESSSIDVREVKDKKDKVVKKVVTVDEIFEKGLVTITPSDVSLARITQIKETPRYLTPSDSISVQTATESFRRFEDLMRSKDYKKALLMLERAIEYDPNNSDYWSYHADFLISAGKELDAMRELKIAIKINPDNPKQLFKIAKLYDRTNNFDTAFRYYTYAIMSDYTFEDAYYERADLALRQNDRKSAIDDYDKLLEVNKNASRAYLERGNLRMTERNFAGAVEDFNSYFDIEDPQGETMYKRGIAKIFMGKIIDGCEDFKISFDIGFADADKAIKKYCQ